MTTVTLSLISHTNVGKTTLARTLLRREIGEVRDAPHVTTTADAHVLIETSEDRLLLWDTPGFGDTVRLLNRLRREHDPIGWFLHQVWDRLGNRPLWCSQEAVRNVRDEADVVLYVVNAAEAPDAAGYLEHELELLSWMNRPVLVVLNQLGTGDTGDLVKRWHAKLSSVAVVRGVLSLDAFSRAWVEESLVLERVATMLEGEKQAAMARLLRAWNDRNLAVFHASIEAIALYLSGIAVDREPLGSPAREGGSWLSERLSDVAALSRAHRDRAVGVLFDRVQVAMRMLMDRLIGLHELSGVSRMLVERRLDDAAVRGNEAINPTIGGIAGGVVSGLLTGLGADVLAGGMTFGGGAVLGAILGAVGGYALGGAYRLAPDGQSAIQFQPAALVRLTREALLRYLVVAHYGRGRGEYADVDHPVHWTVDIDAQLALHQDALEAVWRDAAREGRDAEARIAERLSMLLRSILGAVLRRRFPDATILADPPG